jgi:hypothetical protein
MVEFKLIPPIKAINNCHIIKIVWHVISFIPTSANRIWEGNAFGERFLLPAALGHNLATLNPECPLLIFAGRQDFNINSAKPVGNPVFDGRAYFIPMRSVHFCSIALSRYL